MTNEKLKIDDERSEARQNAPPDCRYLIGGGNLTSEELMLSLRKIRRSAIKEKPVNVFPCDVIG